MDASTNATTTTIIRFSPQSQPHHNNIFSPLPPPPPPTPAAAPPLLHWSTTSNTNSNGGVFSSGSPNLPLTFRNFSSYPPTTATPKKPRPPRRKPDASASASTSTATPKTSTPPCTECGKRFSSWKALFGHMRCHPERQWRGINPPPQFRRPSSPGRAARFSDEEYQVAASLIMLANGPPRGDRGIDVFGWPQRRGSRQTNPRSEREEGVVVHCEVGAKKAWVESEASGSTHNCNLCYKGFSSGQALGGHKRCHWERGEDQVGCSSSSAKNYALDLNLPPPTESSESSPRPVVDLRLGI